jgi:hypothetical protein
MALPSSVDHLIDCVCWNILKALATDERCLSCVCYIAFQQLKHMVLLKQSMHMVGLLYEILQLSNTILTLILVGLLIPCHDPEMTNLLAVCMVTVIR